MGVGPPINAPAAKPPPLARALAPLNLTSEKSPTDHCRIESE